MVNNDSSSLVRFSNFSEDFRQTNCGVPLRIDRPTMLKWNSRHMTSFEEERGHQLWSASSTNNFRWVWLVFEDPYDGLLFCFGVICIDPRFVTCDNFINVFWSTAIVFFPTFLYTNRHEPFYELLSNCAASNENKSFLRSGVHAILNVCWWKKWPRMPLSHGMCHDIIVISFNQFFTVL